MLISPIQFNHARADLIRQCAIFIWEEAPMANRSVFECVEDTCQRVTQSNLPFGNKIFILLGDFRQTCPVIPGGTTIQIIDASIKTSPLWRHFKIRPLHERFRNAADPDFANFVDAIGDGAGPDISMQGLQLTTDPEELIDFVYPPSILTNITACMTRSILAPTNLQVDYYNDIILNRLHGDQHTYLAADSLQEINTAGIVSPHAALDFVATQTPAGLPAHALTMKVGGIYRFLRNFSLDRQLVKNARVTITNIGSRLITVQLLAEHLTSASDDILIPRISFTHNLYSGHTLVRKQFPLAPAYATTFNSCQGMTLDKISIDLVKPVFSHGQLYTALSTIRNRNDVKICLRAEETTTTTYKQILL